MLPSSVRVLSSNGCISQYVNIPQPLAMDSTRQKVQHTHALQSLHVLRSGCNRVRVPQAVSPGTGNSNVSRDNPTPKAPAKGSEAWTPIDSYHFLMANGSHLNARVSVSTSGDARIVVRLEYLSARRPCFLHWCYSPLCMCTSPCPELQPSVSGPDLVRQSSKGDELAGVCAEDPWRQTGCSQRLQYRKLVFSDQI